MALRITLDIFSGLPNPTIILDDEEALDILKRLEPAAKLKGNNARQPPESILGYRGVIIEQIGPRASASLPPQFRLVDGKLFGAKLSHRPTDPAVEHVLSDANGPLRRAQLDPNVFKLFQQELLARKSMTWDTAPALTATPAPSQPVCPCAPNYEPKWWSDAATGGAKQSSNNCYNYATNYRTDTFARPGVGTGQTYPFPTSCVGVRAAAVRDGLVETQATAASRCPKEGHLVALVISPGIDFHWYRRGRDGLWSHKPGVNPVTNLDNSGRPIHDPRTADRGVYTQFCSVMIVLPGHVKIR